MIEALIHGPVIQGFNNFSYCAQYLCALLSVEDNKIAKRTGKLLAKAILIKIAVFKQEKVIHREKGSEPFFCKYYGLSRKQ